LNWLRSYFLRRQQHVNYKNVNSKLMSGNLDVPQGSVVDPILFIIFINVIVKSAIDAQFILFSDDTSSLLSQSCLHSLVQRGSSALSNVGTKSMDNPLALNEF